MKLVIDERQAGFRSGRQISAPAVYVYPEGQRHKTIATFNVRADGSNLDEARQWAELFVAAVNSTPEAGLRYLAGGTGSLPEALLAVPVRKSTGAI